MLHATNSQGKEVMKRHLWMEKKKYPDNGPEPEK